MATDASARKVQILQTLALMLEQPQAARITTAALAGRLQVSEAALYRHFASKAQMFEGLIDRIQLDLQTIFDASARENVSGAAQARSMVRALATFATQNRGMIRVLTGDALVTEDKRLLDRLEQIVLHAQTTLCQYLRNAIVDGSLPATTDAVLQAGVLTDLVWGKWLRFAQSGWRQTPSDDIDAQLDWLIPPVPDGHDRPHMRDRA